MSIEVTFSHRARARYFTPDEANDLLPDLIPEVLRARELLDRGRRLYAAGDRGDAVEEVQNEIKKILDHIHGLGVDVKGLEPGLLDFPALRHGTEVCLCWKEGETEIEHWHPIPTGIAGRRPLSETRGDAWEWCN